jgi:hypothetical protein
MLGTGPAGRYGSVNSNRSATASPTDNLNIVSGVSGPRTQVNRSVQDNESMRSGRSVGTDTAV